MENVKEENMHKNGLKIMLQLVVLVKPLLHIMLITICMGVIGFLASIFITICGGFALLTAAGFETGFTVKGLLIAGLTFALIRGALRYAEQASGHYIAFRLLAIIRDKVFKALRKLAPAKLEERDKGNLISVVTTDIELLEVFYAHTIAPISIAIITSLILIVFMSYYHWMLALIAAVFYIIVGYIIPSYTAYTGREDGRVYREQFGELNSYLLDSLNGLKETIQYGCGKERMKEMLRRSAHLDEMQKRLKNHEGKNKAITDSIILFAALVMSLASLYLYQKGEINFNGVVICTIAMMSSFGPVAALSSLSNNLLQTLASGERVLALLEETPVIEEVVEGNEVDFTGVKYKDVAFSYGKEEILKDFNIELKPGETIGITGRSGSGKSTFLKLLMRFWDRSTGKISISDVDIKEINTSALRKMESYMTQETYLFTGTIEDNIKLVKPEAAREEVEAAAKKAGLHEFIMSLPEGYLTKIGAGDRTVSGGERQRIGIARAFLHDAPLLLLDEPTSNLDSLNEAIILKSIKEECQDKTVILVSHRASTMNVVQKKFSVEHGRLS